MKKKYVVIMSLVVLLLTMVSILTFLRENHEIAPLLEVNKELGKWLNASKLFIHS